MGGVPIAGIPDQWVANFIRSPQFIAIMREQWGYQFGEQEPVEQLPENPFLTQRVQLIVNETLGILWEFVYWPIGAETYPWHFMGGPPMSSYEPASDNITAGSSYVSGGTAGPSLALPYEGDYVFDYSYLGVAGGGGEIHAVPTMTGYTAPNDNYSADHRDTVYDTVSRSRIAEPFTGVSGTAELKYRAATATGTVLRRNLSVIPTRVRRG